VSEPVAGFPRIRISGAPRERGRQYGEQARARICRSVAAYAEVYGHYAGLSWPEACGLAEAFLAPIRAFGDAYAEELHGIAEGAGLELLDVAALNVRTEIVFSALASRHLAGLPAECTAMAVPAARSASGTATVGQNWDWLEHSRDTVVILEIEPDAGPNAVTVVEAGLLAKTGLNAAGLAVVTNSLACGSDRGVPGVPYHVLLRALLGRHSVAKALAVLRTPFRSSSANYLVADATGAIADVEAAPGEAAHLFALPPAPGGTFVHTNHFLTALPSPIVDLSRQIVPDSVHRLARAHELLAARSEPLTVDDWFAIFSDHAGKPGSICCHPKPGNHPLERDVTAASLVFELGPRRIWISEGNPCSAPRHALDYGAFLADVREL
jgi:isopenicillin-N N-acyltransferase like protein